MNNLDQQYIAGLADLAVLGDSNAFAELYAATFQQQYLSLIHIWRDTRQNVSLLWRAAGPVRKHSGASEADGGSV